MPSSLLLSDHNGLADERERCNQGFVVADFSGTAATSFNGRSKQRMLDFFEKRVCSFTGKSGERMTTGSGEALAQLFRGGKVCFVPNQHEMVRLKIQVGEDLLDSADVMLDIAIGGIDHMEQEVCFFEFFKGCFKGLDQRFGKVFDETNRVSDQYFALFGESESSGGGV